jgi:DNA-binding NarL/FixJ family response regulator
VEFNRPGDASPRRVAVASNLRLVAEAVTAALAGRGIVTRKVEWPQSDLGGRRGADPVAALARIRPDVVLLICELDRASRVSDAQDLIRGYDAPWLVMCGDRPGPMWGAMLEAGAAAVVSTTTDLDDLVALLGTVGHEPMMGAVERQALVRQWLAVRADRDDRSTRLASLTPRERTVLGMLYDGDSVAVISAHFDVSPATVRSQVRAILKKLDVNSQIAAVGVLGAMLEEERNLV